jgi:hypothetical protein
MLLGHIQHPHRGILHQMWPFHDIDNYCTLDYITQYQRPLAPWATVKDPILHEERTSLYQQLLESTKK